VREVQIVNVTSGQSAKTDDVYVMTLQPPWYDTSVVTITTQVQVGKAIARGGFFVQSPFNASSTGFVPWNASAETLRVALLKGLRLANATLVQADAQQDAQGRRSWQVKCVNASQALLLNFTTCVGPPPPPLTVPPPARAC
jgi:hypothetical protein